MGVNVPEWRNGASGWSGNSTWAEVTSSTKLSSQKSHDMPGQITAYSPYYHPLRLQAQHGSAATKS